MPMEIGGHISMSLKPDLGFDLSATTPSRFRAYSAAGLNMTGEKVNTFRYLEMHGAALFYDDSRLTLPQQFAAGLAAALRAQEDRQKSGAINPKTSRKRPEKRRFIFEQTVWKLHSRAIFR